MPTTMCLNEATVELAALEWFSELGEGRTGHALTPDKTNRERCPT